MRLVFVLENYHPHIGGVEILFKNLCERLAKRHDVIVITRRLPKTKKHETINNVRLIRVSCPNRYAFTIAAIPAVLKHSRTADVIHTTTYNGMFPAWLAARLRRVPCSITVHETWIGKWRQFSDFSPFMADLHEAAERLLYNLTSFDKYVCVSNSTKRLLEKAVPKTIGRSVRVYNGFDPAPWQQPLKTQAARLRKKLKLEDKWVLLAIGRPGTSKGFQYLIHAFPYVQRNIPHAVLVLILSRDKQYAERIDTYKEITTEDVLFLSPQPYDALPAYRQMADCNVIPSLAEGFGFAVLEACASGNPVVATNTTSIPEVVYGKHVLVKPRSAKALVDGILDVYRKRFKKTPPKSFPWSETVKRYEAVFGEIQ